MTTSPFPSFFSIGVKQLAYHSRQTYVEGKGEVYCGLATRSKRKCPRHRHGYKFPGKKKCKGCQHARYKKAG